MVVYFRLSCCCKIYAFVNCLCINSVYVYMYLFIRFKYWNSILCWILKFYVYPMSLDCLPCITFLLLYVTSAIGMNSYIKKMTKGVFQALYSYVIDRLILCVTCMCISSQMDVFSLLDVVRNFPGRPLSKNLKGFLKRTFLLGAFTVLALVLRFKVMGTAPKLFDKWASKFL